MPEEHIRAVYSLAAMRFFAPRVHELTAVGITGTNGKTSCAWIVAQALALLGQPALYSGTLGMRLFAACSDREGVEIRYRHDTPVTTPFAEQFFQHAGAAQERGAGALVAEVSSHAIAQRRIAGVPWDAGVFTNLTRDHLDYHGSLEQYGLAKAEFFHRDLAESGKERKQAVLNLDDPCGSRIAAELSGGGVRVAGFSRRERAAGGAFLLRASTGLSGSELEVERAGETVCLRSRLVGDYNVENLLAAFAALSCLGYESGVLAAVFPQVEPVPGRLEPVGAEGFGVFVDYAHTPDALVRAQESLRQITAGRLITVFGCGGDRDRGKRPEMGLAVARSSDIGIATSDNPRGEDPRVIISDILPGLEEGKRERPHFVFEEIVERRPAIERAVSLAQAGDAVLIAGKGHEEYQDIGGVKHPFSDREAVAHAIRYRRAAGF
jgi:UDP-N-acetylmuramoyl-L-alanyl-D-glutamate--2,6-diaminopimelate ligase